MSIWHGYLAVQRLVLTDNQWSQLLAVLATYGPHDNSQPANLFHTRLAFDESAMVAEALYDTEDISLTAFKQTLADTFGVDVSAIGVAASDVTFAERATPVWTFAYGGQNRFRVGVLGGLSATWEQSHLEADAYMAADADNWGLNPPPGFGYQADLYRRQQQPYIVTSLADSGPGTLRDALETGGDNLHVTFAVHGRIDLATEIVCNGSNIFIDGASAPAGGVQVIGAYLEMNGDYIVIRHVRMRLGYNAVLWPLRSDCLRLNGQHVWVDHCSFAWAGDEHIDAYGQDITVSNCIIGPGVDKLDADDTGEHSYGTLIAYGGNRVTLLNNLLVLNRTRNPGIAADYESGARVDVVGNLVYGDYAAGSQPLARGGPWRCNYVDNWVMGAPTSKGGNYVTLIYLRDRTQAGYINDCRLYHAGNVNLTKADPDYIIFPQDYEGTRETDLIYLAVNKPGPVGGYVSAESAYSTPAELLAVVGAQPRDSVDVALVAHVEGGTAFDTPTGYPYMADVFFDEL